jgi:16S rRNA (guanine1516-N2)-methyltransferase
MRFMMQSIGYLMNNISVTCEDETRHHDAMEISLALGLPFGNQGHIQLCALKDKWVLTMPGTKPMWVEFDAAFWRNDKRVDKQEGLIRACKPTRGLHIVDLTAGFGRDAALLSARGARVTLIERDPIMQVLLKDGLTRAVTSGALQENEIQLICGEAKTHLLQLAQAQWPDVIYLDPMHPPREKSAKVKKIMQSLQAWIEPDLDVETLLALARTRVSQRVVVKWPARLPPLMTPNHSIQGKTIRFDVYLPAGKLTLNDVGWIRS